MSDRRVRLLHDSEGTSEPSLHPCTSVWMAHWKCSSCKSETKACGHVSIHYEGTPLGSDHEKKHPLFRGLGELTEPKRVRRIDEGLTLTDTSKEIRKESWEGQSFPMFNVPPKSNSAKHNQQDFTFSRGVLRESSSPAMLGWTTADAWPLEAIPSRPERQVKLHNFLEVNSPAVSKSFQDEPLRSDSKLSPNQCKGSSASVPPFICRDNEINQPIQPYSLLALKHVADTNIDRSSTFVSDEGDINSKLVSKRSGVSLYKQNDAALGQHDPSSSRKHAQETQNKSGMGLFPCQNTPSKVTKHENVYHGYYSPPKLQHVKIMRICAAVNAEKESSSGHPKFSQTSHFQLSRKTGVNLSEGVHMFEDSTASLKLKGKAVRIPEPGLKLLPYRSSTDSEEENVRNAKRHPVNLNNESSSDTDTMDMGAFPFQENLLGVASSPKNEPAERSLKSPIFLSAFTSAREEIGGRPPFTKLPDMNQELPELAALASLADERETSTSRTQSLDVEHLLSNAELLTNSKSSASPDGPQGIEPSCRWVKRLKLSASHSSYGTKSTKMGEASSHEKAAIFSERNMKCSVTNSQPAMGRFHGREMALDELPMLLKNGESSSNDSAKSSHNITLSHPWIRRWSQKVVAPRKNSEELVVFQPQCSKAALDQYQKKQFPSIAAMALMGKAMNGFNLCEFANKGSFVVWNTKGF